MIRATATTIFIPQKKGSIVNVIAQIRKYVNVNNLLIFSRLFIYLFWAFWNR
jgi:hypothetical protein